MQDSNAPATRDGGSGGALEPEGWAGPPAPLAAPPQRPVEPEPCVAQDFPIAFSSLRVESERYLVALADNGVDLRRVLRTAHVFAPAWSPGGRRLAYHYRLSPLRGQPGRPTLEIARATGEGAVGVVLLEPDDDVEAGLGIPRWSPDGERIVFASVREGGPPRVWIATASGAPPRLALPGYERALRSPTWSPSDPDVLVVAGEQEDGTAGLYRASLSEGRVERIELGAEFDVLGWPRWDSEGRRLAFEGVLASDAGRQVWNVFAFDLERSELSQVTDHPGIDRTPTWSPDGSSLVFSSSRRRAAGRGVELWRVSLDELESPSPLSGSSGDDRWPDWYRGGGCGDD